MARTADALTHSLRQTAVWYAERHGIPGDAARNENLKQLLRDQLDRWHAEGAGWIEISGHGAGRRLKVDLEHLERAVAELPRCECGRPALRGDEACGTCGHGRTGRPRKMVWELQTCAGCGHEELAPIYGRQKRWWCGDCNGRQKYEPHECERAGCSNIATGGDRFCGQSCAAKARWSAGTLGDRERENWRRIMRQHHAATREITTGEGVLTLGLVAERLHVSTWTPYAWRRRGLLPVTAHFGGRVLTTEEEHVKTLIRRLAVANHPLLLDPGRALVARSVKTRLRASKPRVIEMRRELIIPHRAGAKRKDELRAELRPILQTLAQRYDLTRFRRNEILAMVGEEAWHARVGDFRDRYPADRWGDFDLSNYRKSVVERVAGLIGPDVKALLTPAIKSGG